MKLVVVFLACVAYALAQCSATTCSTCTQISLGGNDHCTWCQDAYGQNSCGTSQTASGANCTDGGETPDVFITTPAECYGGCQSAEYCSQCGTIPGCGWCYSGPTVGCVDTGSGAASSCLAFAVGSNVCNRPCIAIADCHSCTQSTCEWCPGTNGATESGDGTCGDIGTQTACVNALMTTEGSCPALPPNSASAVAISGLVLIAALF